MVKDIKPFTQKDTECMDQFLDIESESLLDLRSLPFVPLDELDITGPNHMMNDWWTRCRDNLFDHCFEGESNSNITCLSEPLEHMASSSSNTSSPQSNAESNRSDESVCVAKRRRGRPPITDPVIKEEHKKVSQIKASVNYRRKQKIIREDIDRQYECCLRENQNLSLQSIELWIKCERLVNKCSQFEHFLNRKQMNRFKKSQKTLTSIEF